MVFIYYCMTYDRRKALAYAAYWWDKHNPKYSDFAEMGGDCTNFISQILHEGGIPMNFEKYGWFYCALNLRAPAFSGVNEFYDFAVHNKSVTGVRLIEVDKSEIEEGDVVQLGSDERFYHTLFISKILQGIIYVAAHDNDAFNRPLYTYSAKRLRYLHVLN